MTTREFLARVSQYSNYIIIGVASMLSVFFFPFVGSTVGLQLSLPNTVAGWVVFIATKLCVGFINILIFHCFTTQAKINIKDDPSFKLAEELLRTTEPEQMKPLSPKEFFTREYTIKGTSVFIVSILSAFSLAQAVLTFDLMMMLTYIFTIVMGVIAGFLQMKKVEEYWTIDYLNYAKERQREFAAKALEASKESEASGNNIGGASILESADSTCDSCVIC